MKRVRDVAGLVGTPVRAAVAASVATAAVTVGVASATHEGAVIFACVSNSSGAVRIVDEGVGCRTGETSRWWNQDGPQGLQGEQGPVGPQGPQGPPGPASVRTQEVPVVFASSPSGPVTADFLASCTTGEKPLSGGFVAQNQVVLTASHPTADGRQWRFRFRPTGTAPTAARR
jgi:hypothetical protein